MSEYNFVVINSASRNTQTTKQENQIINTQTKQSKPR